MTTHTMPICLGCSRYGGLLGTGCEAFPKGIPAAIIEDRFDHRSSYPGDHGLRFAPAANGAQVIATVEADRAHMARVVLGQPR